MKNFLRDARRYLEAGSGFRFYVTAVFDIGFAALLTVLGLFVAIILWLLFFLQNVLLTPFLFLVLAFSRPTYHPWSLIFLICGILFSTAMFSLSRDSWLPFQRSGSILVAIAVLAFSTDYKARLSKSSKQIIENMLGFVSMLQENPSIYFPKVFVTRFEDRIAEWRMHDLDRSTKIAKAWETSIVVLGTLVWGYGDLLGRFWD